MILYKYVTAEIARLILQNHAIRFTEPQFFNDPFDLPSYPEEKSGNAVEEMFSRVRVMGKNMTWAPASFH